MEIVLECRPDEALIKSLGFAKKYITHQPNKGEVINYLEKNPTAIGMVDEDPGAASPKYLSKFKREGQTVFGIDLFRFKTTKLIIVKPRLEDWVLAQAQLAQVDPEEFF